MGLCNEKANIEDFSKQISVRLAKVGKVTSFINGQFVKLLCQNDIFMVKSVTLKMPKNCLTVTSLTH